jgi:FAD/FMN-containing dehydrogenase
MRKVVIDAAAGIAHVGAGAVWQDVSAPAGEQGLAALAGNSADVGVVGYTLGGGIGWLARGYGLAANSVVRAEVVTADGRLARTDAGHEPDLFWAVRGGGSVGVVTSMDMALYPLRQVYAGALFFPIERASEVLDGWREWTDTVPDNLTSIARLLRLPPAPEVSETLRGRAFALVEAAYLGDATKGSSLLRPLRELRPELDTFADMPPAALSRLHMDPDQPVPAQGDGVLLADLPAAAIWALLAVAGPAADTSLASVEVRHLGGALARRPGTDAGAQASIDAKYLTFAVGFTPTPDQADRVRAEARTLSDALRPWHARYDYYNLKETPAEARAVMPLASYHRLQNIKARYDPDQAIISAHPACLARH